MYTIVFFLFFPLYSYICILSRDNLVYYHQLLQSRLMCLFYTENMFLLKQMRANLKEKIMSIVGKLGPEIFEDFDNQRIVKPDGTQPNGKLKRPSSIQDLIIEGKPISYYHEIELNNVFETLNVSFKEISEFMEGIEKDQLNF
jgi:hypothetical protein